MARGVPKLRREMRAEGSRSHSASPSRCSSSFSLSLSSSSCFKTSTSSNKQSHPSSDSTVNTSSPLTKGQRHQAPSSSPRRNERLGSSSARRPLLRGANAQSVCPPPPIEFPSPTSKKALGQKKPSPRLNADTIPFSSSSRLSTNKTATCRERPKKTDNVGSGEGVKKKNSETFSTVKKPALVAKPKHLDRRLSTPAPTTAPSSSSGPCTKVPSKETSPLARSARKRKGHDGETCSSSRNSSRSSINSSSVDNKAGEGRRSKREEEDKAKSKKKREKKKKTGIERTPSKQGVPRPSHRVNQSEKRRRSTSQHKRLKGGVLTSSGGVVRSRFLSATQSQVDRKKRKGMNSSYVPEKKKSKVRSMGDRCSSPRFKSSLNGEADPSSRCEAGDEACAEGEKSQTHGLHTKREHAPNAVISSSSSASSGGGNTPRKRQKKEEQEEDMCRSSVNSRKEGCQRNGDTIPVLRAGKKETGKNRGMNEDEGEANVVVRTHYHYEESEESVKRRGLKTSSGKKKSGSNGVGMSQNRTSLKKAQVNKLTSPFERGAERDELPNIESAVEAAHDGRAGAKQSRGRRPSHTAAWGVTMSSSDFSTHGEENTPSSSPVLSSSSSLKKRSPRLYLSSPSLSSSSSRRPPVKESASGKGRRGQPSSLSSTLVRRESTDSSGGLSSCSSGVNNLAGDSPCCSPASSALSSSSSFPPPPPPLPVLNSKELSRGKKASLGGNTRGKHSEKTSKSGGGSGGRRSEKGGKRGSPRLDPGVCTADLAGLSSISGEKEGSSAGIGSSSSPSFSASSSSTTLQGLHRTNHRHWQNNCLLLYEHVMAHTLEWPSLTAQWMNSYGPKKDGEIGQTVLVATHTSGAHHPNYLLLIEVTLPVRPIPPSGMNYDQRQDYSGFEFGDEDTRKFTVTSRIPHEGECNRARFCPQAQSKVASKALDGSVYIFDISKFGPDVFHPSSPVFFGSSSSSSLSKSHSLTGKGGGGDSSKRGSDSDEETEDFVGMHASSTGPGDYMTDQAEVVLYGHSAEGWGLDWAPPSSGKSACVASASDDALVCVWDIQAKPSSSKRIPPLHKLVGDSNMRPLQDVRWKTGEGEGEILLAVGDDGYLSMWDLRASHLPVLRTQCSGTCLNALALNEHAPSVVATGGSDQGVNIWDLREMKRPAHRLLRAHSEAITCLKWSPHQKTVIASGSTDRLIRIYDLSLVGSEQESDEAEDGPPELLFVHGGHGGGISDFDWNPLKDLFTETPVGSITLSSSPRSFLLGLKLLFIDTYREHLPSSTLLGV
ncbi:wd-40 repeat [Cystoisospora suis]|uniref:Wd-40 repeat n=1 Tax=Cystoisospora suis TaxID=483139 RepID=A0A2C6KJ89_9APIC|nr:wd-40 repeat [Cystoisospora suis]